MSLYYTVEIRARICLSTPCLSWKVIFLLKIVKTSSCVAAGVESTSLLKTGQYHVNTLTGKSIANVKYILVWVNTMMLFKTLNVPLRYEDFCWWLVANMVVRFFSVFCLLHNRYTTYFLHFDSILALGVIFKKRPFITTGVKNQNQHQNHDSDQYKSIKFGTKVLKYVHVILIFPEHVVLLVFQEQGNPFLRMRLHLFLFVFASKDYLYITADLSILVNFFRNHCIFWNHQDSWMIVCPALCR